MKPRFAEAIAHTVSKLCALHAQVAVIDEKYMGTAEARMAGTPDHAAINRVALCREIAKTEKSLAALLLQPGSQ